MLCMYVFDSSDVTDVVPHRAKTFASATQLLSLQTQALLLATTCLWAFLACFTSSIDKSGSHSDQAT